MPMKGHMMYECLLWQILNFHTFSMKKYFLLKKSYTAMLSTQVT